jgi:hypothetical protein
MTMWRSLSCARLSRLCARRTRPRWGPTLSRRSCGPSASCAVSAALASFTYKTRTRDVYRSASLRVLVCRSRPRWCARARVRAARGVRRGATAFRARRNCCDRPLPDRRSRRPEVTDEGSVAGKSAARACARDWCGSDERPDWTPAVLGIGSHGRFWASSPHWRPFALGIHKFASIEATHSQEAIRSRGAQYTLARNRDWLRRNGVLGSEQDSGWRGLEGQWGSAGQAGMRAAGCRRARAGYAAFVLRRRETGAIGEW